MANRKYIATRLHQLAELAPDDEEVCALPDKAHYVIDRRLTEMFAREDVSRSIDAVITAGIAKLPFSEVVIEFDTSDNTRRITHLWEVDDKTIGAKVFALNYPALTITQDPIEIEITNGVPPDMKPGLVIRAERAGEVDKLSAMFATCISFLMLNIAGIEKEIIDPAPLNRKRGKSGRAPIPRHTVLRIGTVIGRDGKPVSGGGARGMPVHLRAGHMRHQHYGPGNTDVKLIYIEPVLVNFKPGDEESEVRMPKRVLTK